jgi:V/A-type H+-transporting ATPase subunit K
MLEILAPLAEIVLHQDGSGVQEAVESAPALTSLGAAALAVGLAAIGTGYAQRGIGSAAVGAVAEDDDMFVRALIFTALPETLIIIAFVTIFLTQ